MLPSLRRATSRLAGSLEPRAPCTCAFFSPSKSTSEGLTRSRKGKEVRSYSTAASLERLELISTYLQVVRQLQTRSLSSSTALATEPLVSFD